MEYLLEGSIDYSMKDQIMLTCKEDKVEEAKFNFNQIYRDAVDLTWDDEIEMDEEPA
jgi:hypothetical protein